MRFATAPARIWRVFTRSRISSARSTAPRQRYTELIGPIRFTHAASRSPTSASARRSASARDPAVQSISAARVRAARGRATLTTALHRDGCRPRPRHRSTAGTRSRWWRPVPARVRRRGVSASAAMPAAATRRARRRRAAPPRARDRAAVSPSLRVRGNRAARGRRGSSAVAHAYRPSGRAASARRRLTAVSGTMPSSYNTRAV